MCVNLASTRGPPKSHDMQSLPPLQLSDWKANRRSCKSLGPWDQLAQNRAPGGLLFPQNPPLLCNHPIPCVRRGDRKFVLHEMVSEQKPAQNAHADGPSCTPSYHGPANKSARTEPATPCKMKGNTHLVPASFAMYAQTNTPCHRRQCCEPYPDRSKACDNKKMRNESTQFKQQLWEIIIRHWRMFRSTTSWPHQSFAIIGRQTLAKKVNKLSSTLSETRKHNAKQHGKLIATCCGVPGVDISTLSKSVGVFGATRDGSTHQLCPFRLHQLLP